MTSKKIFWILNFGFCVLIFSSVVIAASSPNDKKLIIHNANTIIDNINHAADVRVDSSDNIFDWLGYRTEGGGTLYAFRQRDSVVKIVAEMYHAFGMVRLEMYYDNGEPVFFYEREDYYPKKDTTLDHSRLVYGHDARYYIHNRTLIDSKRRGKDKFGVKATPAQAVTKLLLMSDRWKNYFHKH